MSSKVLDLLRSMDLFTDLPDTELNKIARLLKEHKYAENELIFVQGEPGDGLYIILQGRVRIASTDQLGRERVLAFYGPGEFFGDMAVLTGEPRSATASASTNLRVLQLRKDDFDVLVATSVGMMRGMLRVMVERQTAMNMRLSQEVGATTGDVRGQVTVVFSPRGGAGQTILTTNLAVALAELTPDRVAILDLDLLFGHVSMLLGVPPERIRYVQNQPSPYGKLSRTELAELVGSDQVVEVPFGGEEVSKAGLNGFPLVMGHSANPTSRAIIGIARELEQSGRELLALR